MSGAQRALMQHVGILRGRSMWARQVGLAAQMHMHACRPGVHSGSAAGLVLGVWHMWLQVWHGYKRKMSAAATATTHAQLYCTGGDGKGRETLHTRFGKYYYVERSEVPHCGPKGEACKDKYFQQLLAQGFQLCFRYVGSRPAAAVKSRRAGRQLMQGPGCCYLAGVPHA